MVTAPGKTALSEGEVTDRAARIRLVLTDCDGVLTDAGVYYSARGEELKRFSLRDGMGVELLRNAGIDTAIITREKSEIVLRRAEKLKIRAHLGVADKAAALDGILSQHGVTTSEVAYIGDDVNDLGAIERIRVEGLSAAPRDAVVEVSARVHFVASHPGGHGAFRDFAEWLLRAKKTS